VSHNCRAKLVLPTVGKEGGKLVEELRALAGDNVGTICRILNLPHKPRYQSVIDAASKIAYDENRFMSA
jgi:Na+/H+-translocating membrane pyrophosphatase